jgi:hypothetical protein
LTRHLDHGCALREKKRNEGMAEGVGPCGPAEPCCLSRGREDSPSPVSLAGSRGATLSMRGAVRAGANGAADRSRRRHRRTQRPQACTPRRHPRPAVAAGPPKRELRPVRFTDVPMETRLEAADMLIQGSSTATRRARCCWPQAGRQRRLTGCRASWSGYEGRREAEVNRVRIRLVTEDSPHEREHVLAGSYPSSRASWARTPAYTSKRAGRPRRRGRPAPQRR